MKYPTGDLPYLTSGLPGIGGRLRVQANDFIVEEVPLYQPSGSGNHLYISVTREGLTTPRVQEALARLFGLPQRSIGYAGLKDRNAQTTQVFSLPGLSPSQADRIERELVGVQVNWAQRHTNKLKSGHLLGNRFRIVVRGVGSGALEQVQSIIWKLQQEGAPNYFGPQRFGTEGDNAERGREALFGKGPRKRWLRRFLISAYQSLLFNRYLALRLERGLFGRLLPGDVAKKEATGGMFSIETPESEQERYQRGEIHFTGPLFGGKMWTATGEAGTLEAEVLAESGVTLEDFARNKIPGTRRPGRIWVPQIEIRQEAEDALAFSFFLRKGAFATSLLREIMKDDRAAR